MPDPLPIVFLHYGNSSYLPFTLGQAKLANLASPIVMIGDQTNKIFPFVTHVNMNHYARQAAEFQKVYRHLSPNGPSYEIFCFVRWFLLRDFLLAHGLTRIIHLDSDVLLYADVNREAEYWQRHELSLVNGVCAGNMFVNGTAALIELCDLIWDLYTGPDSEQRLQSAYAERQKIGGGVSDMTVLKMLYDRHPRRIAEMTGIQPDNSFWDANIHMDEGFEMDGPRKKIYWQDSLPFGRHLASGRLVRFKSLHFQGIAKDHIEPAFRRGSRQAA